METLLSGLFETMFDFLYKPNTVTQCLRTAAYLCETKYKGATIKNLSERILKALKSNALPEYPDLQRGLEVVEGIIAWAHKQDSQEIAEALWIVAPRLIQIDLTVRYPPSLERWGWLRHFFDYPNGDKQLRCRDRLQEPLRLKLTEVFSFKSGSSEETTTDSNNEALYHHELFDPVMDLLSIEIFTGLRSISVLDFETLEQAFAPNVVNVVASALQTTSNLMNSAVFVLLALSERWPSYYRVGGALPSTQVREEVYGTLQTSLQDDLCEAPVEFMRLLLDGMKENGEDEFALEAPNDVFESGGNEASDSRTITTARSQRLEPIIAKLLNCFIETRWSDVQAVQLLIELTSTDGISDAVVSCLSKVSNIWNEDPGGFGDVAPSVASLAKSLVRDKDWRDGVNLLLDLVFNDTCIDTCDAAIRELLFLTRKPDLWETAMHEIKSRIETLPLDKTKDDTTKGKLKGLLIVISVNEPTRDFCSYVLDRLDNENIDGQNLILPTSLPEVSFSSYTKQMEDLSLHSDVPIRQAALEFLTQTVSESSATLVVGRLVGLALNDSDERLKRSCLTRLVDIALNPKLILPVIDGMKEMEQIKLDTVSDAAWRKGWVALLGAVSRRGTHAGGVAALLRIAKTDELWEVRVAAMHSLSELAGDHSEAIVMRTILAENVEVLRLNDPSSQARKAWASTLGRLSTKGHWKEGQDALIGMALYDYDEGVRHHAYQEIVTLLNIGVEHVASITTSLTSALEGTLREGVYYTYWFTDLGSTGSEGRVSPLTMNSDLASALLNPLIKQALVHSDASYWIDRTLDLVAKYTNPGHHKAILNSVIQNLSASSPHGAKKAIDLVYQMGQTSRRASGPGRLNPFLASLPPLFQHTSTHVRVAALRLFSTIYLGDEDWVDRTDVVIPHLISMVLEDHDDGLRVEAAGWLRIVTADYWSENLWHVGRELAAQVNIDRFLELLSASRPLNTTVARLLGVLYKREDAFERIGSWIIDKAVVARDIPSNLEQGILTLLSELVGNSAFFSTNDLLFISHDVPTLAEVLRSTVALDYLLLLLSSSLALKGTPATEPHRPLILASLSLYYQNRIPDQSSECFEELTRAFEYAAFGRHGTEAEAKAWLAMGQYFQEQQQPPQNQNAEGEQRVDPQENAV
ncbi:armadillo-type protein [Coprinopsis sp. MPI-PUGE-AT-0042]|nr:armadillo-type protein [Coprinopsis sp. MPI-PUGE-AT-0042]